MTATPLPKDNVVLTDAQIDAYIAFNIARVDLLLAKRRRTMAPRPMDQRQRVRLVPCV